jgi:hypothetical protein
VLVESHHDIRDDSGDPKNPQLLAADTHTGKDEVLAGEVGERPCLRPPDQEHDGLERRGDAQREDDRHERRHVPHGPDRDPLDGDGHGHDERHDHDHREQEGNSRGHGADRAQPRKGGVLTLGQVDDLSHGEDRDEAQGDEPIDRSESQS